MDLDFRDWLIIVGIVSVAGVLLHGFWRMWTDSDRLTVKLDKTFMSDSSLNADQNDLSLFKAELPNGGARIIQVGESNIPVSDQSPAKEDVEETENGLLHSTTQTEASLQAVDGEVFNNTEPKQGTQNGPLQAGSEPESSQPEVSQASQNQSGESEKLVAEPVQSEVDEKYVVINVLGDIQGSILFESLQKLGFAFGEMNIFHFDSPESGFQFSLANAVEPGSFDLEEIDELVTPGVILFMRAHELKDPVACFEHMIVAGVRLAEDLGAQLCDESRSMMTEQAIEYRKQDLQEYQYRRMR